MEELTIDNYPTIDATNNKITTEFAINSEEEISISVNNGRILSKNDINEIENNVITLEQDSEIEENDIIVVIYHKL